MKEKTAESKPVGKLANAMLCFCALVYLIIFVPVDAWLKMVGAGASILFLFHIEATARQLIAVRKIKQLKIPKLFQPLNYLREFYDGNSGTCRKDKEMKIQEKGRTRRVCVYNSRSTTFPSGCCASVADRKQLSQNFQVLYL